MSAAVRLDELLANIAPAPPVNVEGLSLDSRNIAEGEVFVALRGGNRHGLEHAHEAAARGARAILWDPAEGQSPGRRRSLMFPSSRCASCAIGSGASRTGFMACRHPG